MDVLVVDLTHGGAKIAVEIGKFHCVENIFLYDIYNTIKDDEKRMLDYYNIILLSDEIAIRNYINNMNNNNFNNKYNNNYNINKKNNKKLLVINPIHSPFNILDIINRNNLIYENDVINGNDTIDINGVSIKEITHHNAVNLILKKWKKSLKHENIPIIEVTGVKGKTSVVAMLKEILIDKNPLVLSSLGAILYKNKANDVIILNNNISISPASILETVKIANVSESDCIKIKSNKSNKSNISFELCESNKSDVSVEPDKFSELNFNVSYGSCIFESSLGVTGLGDIGVLTNIVENYTIAKNTSSASNAKKQVFNCDNVVIEKETLEKYYPEKNDGNHKINTFSFNDKTANLYVDELKLDLNNTNIKIIYNNIKTNSGKMIDGYLDVNTFAPGKHHVLNVLASITTALTYDINKKVIIMGLSNFVGIKGRTSLKTQKGQVIIEEINPGINTKAIENSIDMIRHLNNLNDYEIIIGGKYGVTCEEIDENKVATLLDNLLWGKFKNNEHHQNKEFYLNLTLTDDLGKEIGKKMKNSVKFIENPFEAQKSAIENEKKILFIYRSNYSQISKR